MGPERKASDQGESLQPLVRKSENGSMSGSKLNYTL